MRYAGASFAVGATNVAAVLDPTRAIVAPAASVVMTTGVLSYVTVAPRLAVCDPMMKATGLVVAESWTFTCSVA